MKKAKYLLAIGVMLIAGLSGCGNNQLHNEVEEGTIGTDTQTEIMNTSEAVEQSSNVNIGTDNVQNIGTNNEEITMNITIGDMTYAVRLDDNETTRDIVEKMPLELSMVRYAGHEYYSELPFTPEFDNSRTSNIKAGHVYYWDGWNAFVINYEDYDISPYKVVHIGEITDAGISQYLSGAEDTISISVTK